MGNTGLSRPQAMILVINYFYGRPWAIVYGKTLRFRMCCSSQFVHPVYPQSAPKHRVSQFFIFVRVGYTFGGSRLLHQLPIVTVGPRKFSGFNFVQMTVLIGSVRREDLSHFTLDRAQYRRSMAAIFRPNLFVRTFSGVFIESYGLTVTVIGRLTSFKM